MDTEKIIKKVIEKYNIKKVEIISNYKYKTVINLDNRYVIKVADSKRLQSEKVFLQLYKDSPCIEEFIEFNEKDSYSLYQYENGEEYQEFSKAEALFQEIIKITQNYKSVNNPGYGDLCNSKKSWYEFLKDEYIQKRKDMQSDIAKGIRVEEELENIKKYRFEKKMIHGDLGIYNIIIEENKIKKIIDPRTIVGDPLYDVIFFVLSNKKIINNIGIKKVIEEINEPIDKILSLMFIILYDRISILKKHKVNYKDYEELWEKIENYK